MSGRQRQEKENKRMAVWEECVLQLLASKTVEDGCKQLLDDTKGKEMSFPQEPPQGIQSCQHTDFRTRRSILDVWPPQF